MGMNANSELHRLRCSFHEPLTRSGLGRPEPMEMNVIVVVSPRAGDDFIALEVSGATLVGDKLEYAATENGETVHGALDIQVGSTVKLFGDGRILHETQVVERQAQIETPEDFHFEGLDLSVRVMNCLRNLSFEDDAAMMVSAIAKLDTLVLEKNPNMGLKSLRELHTALTEAGFPPTWKVGSSKTLSDLEKMALSQRAKIHRQLDPFGSKGVVNSEFCRIVARLAIKNDRDAYSVPELVEMALAGKFVELLGFNMDCHRMMAGIIQLWAQKQKYSAST